MKHFTLILSYSLCLLLLVSCGNKKKDNEQTNTEAQANEQAVENKSKENTAAKTKEATNSESGNYDIANIEKGDIIEGLKVIKKEYKPNEYFNIELEGQKKIFGTLVYNEFEDSWEISVDKEDLPKTYIIINGDEYELYSTVAVRNREEFKKALDPESLSMVKNGQGVKVRFTYKNFSIGQNFDKGRKGVAYADYTTGK